MSFRIFVFSIAFPFVSNVLAMEVSVSEKVLMTWARSQAPSVLQYWVQEKRDELSKEKFQDRYAPKAFSSFFYRQTNEEPFIAFQPVISPESIFTLGAEKRFSKGFSSEARIQLDRRKFSVSGVPEDVSIGEISIGATLDLWRNFLGRMDASELSSLQASVSQSTIHREIGTHIFFNQLRGIYYRLIALDDSIAIAAKLYESAKAQEKDAAARFKDSIADQGDLARYRSQTASTKSRVTFLEFERQKQIQSLRNLVPDLKDAHILIEPFSMDELVKRVFQCVERITQYSQPPYDFTLYDELASEIEVYHQSRVKMAQRYSDPNLELEARVFSLAVNDSRPEALGEALSRDRQGFEIGLSFDIPFGTQSTRDRQIEMEKLEGRYQKDLLLQNVSSTHSFVLESIKLLLDTAQNQSISERELSKRVRDSKRKFEQGRISVTDYIDDQDRLLQAGLNLIDTKTVVIQTLLEYLSVFQKTDCAFNPSLS